MALRMNNKIVKIVTRLLQIIITIVIFVYLIHKTDFSRVIKLISDIDLSRLIISFIVLVAAQPIYFAVWFFVVKKLNMRVSFREVVFFSFQALFVNNLLTFIGGDIYRGVKLNSITKSKFNTTFSILITRYLMVLTLFILAGISLVLFGDLLGLGSRVIFAGILVLVLCLSYILFVALYCRSEFVYKDNNSSTFIKKILLRLINKHIVIGQDFKFFLFLMLLNFTGHIMGFFSLWILSRSLELNLPFLYIISFMPLLRIILMVPISFNGVGIREISFVVFLTKFGFMRTEALSLGLMQSFLTVLMSLLGGVFLVYEILKTNKHEIIS
ncbi:flippase-like domain-containing protein [bacterium]|nr:flippase-like domain-containing protein [bacterium]